MTVETAPPSMRRIGVDAVRLAATSSCRPAPGNVLTHATCSVLVARARKA